MNRYKFPLIVDNTKGVRYNLSVIPNTIPTEDVPFFYVTKFGDRLDVLSNTFYKTPKYWWVIAKANNLVNGTVAVGPGTRLFIPNIL
jgi:nucleoid-associated protein YgaU